MNDNLFALFHARFPADRGRIFLETERGEAIDFATLDELVARHAGFVRSLGVAPGERVAVQVEKSVEALVLYLACLRAGVIYLPLNSAYRESEIAYFLGDAEPRIFVHAARDENWAAPLCESLGIRHRFTMDAGKRDVEIGSGSRVWAENARKAAPMLEIENRRADDLAAILYTSGTTGRSKGAMITHGNLSSNALTLHSYWGFRPDDVLVHALPLFHVHGLFVAANTILLNGGKMLFHTRFDPKTVIAALPRATVFMGVPTFYTRLLGEAGFDASCCRHMRLFVSGSAPLLTETFHAFQARTGHTILERYGMTETGMNTSNPLAGERRAGTVGFPLPGVDVRVVDDEQKASATGTIGHIQVKGPNVLPGYWRMPEKTRDEFTHDGFFKTGDMGLFDKDGYLSIVGRSKDLVISGGYNVYPKEIEMLLDEFEGVVESAVIGLPHPDFGEAVAAVLVQKPGVVIDESAVIAQLKGKLANFKVPKRVFVVDDLPRNTMGKVQKNELRKRFASTFA
jgi:malonyl-CoA/methylmalonyl-CoA synthetase